MLRDGELRAVMGTGPVDLAPGRLADVETIHAMTIRKSQGSQATKVAMLLAAAGLAAADP